MNKAQSQASHAKRRLRERYGININRHEYLEMCRMIRDNKTSGENKAMFIRRETSRVTKWLLCWNDERLFCLYDKKRQRIVTFLGPEMV